MSLWLEASVKEMEKTGMAELLISPEIKIEFIDERYAVIHLLARVTIVGRH